MLVDAALAARVVQQHQREQPDRLGLVGHQRDERAPEPDRLAGERAAQQVGARARRVALVEQAGRAPRAPPPCAPAAGARAGCGTGCPRCGSCAWRARCAAPSSARERGTRVRSRAVVSPHSVRSVERDLRVDRERGVTAREDQPQAVVLDAAVVECVVDWIVARREHGGLPELRRAGRGAAARSIARLRAAVVSHAPGLRGTPSRRHVSRASAKASCAHSSATSQSPVTRMSVATTRPHSSRKAAATAASTSALTSPRSAAPRSSRTRAPGILRRDLDRLVEVLAVDDEVAADLLLGLGERTVGGERLAVADAHGRGVGGRAQALAALEQRRACPSPPSTRRTRPCSPPALRGSSASSAVSSVQIIIRYRMGPPR